ncbi:hypothetical protein ACQKNB_08635 [Lysinibacillus xylanilyticus]|uniref:hypothetical protein n=1 Tax=Lysinibacillus xylanilyticus TaxID=582475 RepID=UPI003D08F7E5
MKQLIGRPGKLCSVRKRSVSNKCFLCESEASATNVFCAKAKRQQQMFSVRKRSVSGKAPSRNGNQPHVMLMSCYLIKRVSRHIWQNNIKR